MISMGYNRVECVGKGYEVGHLLFLLFTCYLFFLFFSFCYVVPAEKGTNDGKETGVLLNSTFIPRFTTIS